MKSFIISVDGLQSFMCCLSNRFLKAALKKGHRVFSHGPKYFRAFDVTKWKLIPTLLYLLGFFFLFNKTGKKFVKHYQFTLWGMWNEYLLRGPRGCWISRLQGENRQSKPKKPCALLMLCAAQGYFLVSGWAKLKLIITRARKVYFCSIPWCLCLLSMDSNEFPGSEKYLVKLILGRHFDKPF